MAPDEEPFCQSDHKPLNSATKAMLYRPGNQSSQPKHQNNGNRDPRILIFDERVKGADDGYANVLMN